MKVLLLFFCFYIITPNFLNAKEMQETWKAGKEFIPMIRDSEKHLLFSAACANKKCDALLKTANISWSDAKVRINLDGGKNPGAVFCKDVLKQRIIYLKNLKGDENTFCIFQDMSFISSSSLAALIKTPTKIKKKQGKNAKK